VRWTDLSANPDDSAVLKFRRDSVRSTKSTDVDSLENFIAGRVRDRRVLDLGYANHDADTHNIAQLSTHGIVIEHADDVIGVDVVESGLVNQANRTYFKGNILRDFLLRDSVIGCGPIDVLFAGNLLEHLDSPSELFELFKVLRERCGTLELVVLVPNPLWLIGLFDMLRHEETDLSLNVDHVNTFYPGALVELGERHDCQLVSWKYVGRADMARMFAPRPRKTQLFWAAFYYFSRKRRSAFSYNQIGAVFN
jgi:hypothetical protein